VLIVVLLQLVLLIRGRVRGGPIFRFFLAMRQAVIVNAIARNIDETMRENPPDSMSLETESKAERTAVSKSEE
jgi:hypothetical protein